jgi:hypothetical protein
VPKLRRRLDPWRRRSSSKSCLRRRFVGVNQTSERLASTPSQFATPTNKAHCCPTWPAAMLKLLQLTRGGQAGSDAGAMK